MGEIVWSDAASEQLDDIIAYIEQFDPVAAAQIGMKIFALGQSRAEFPSRGRPAGGGKRELVTVPPYILRYRVSGDKMNILSVRHGRQRPGPDRA